MSLPSAEPRIASPSLLRCLRRGFGRRCPRCGVGRLLAGYLGVPSRCGHCAEPYERLRSDDAPAYFTIAIVGHVAVAGLLLTETTLAPPLWLQFAAWLPATLALTLALLPRIKGAVMAAICSLKPMA